MGSSHAALGYLQREYHHQTARGKGGMARIIRDGSSNQIGGPHGLGGGALNAEVDAFSPHPGAASLTADITVWSPPGAERESGQTDLLYELSWRLGQWHDDPLAGPSPSPSSSSSPHYGTFNECTFFALRALSAGEPSGFAAALSSAASSITSSSSLSSSYQGNGFGAGRGLVGNGGNDGDSDGDPLLADGPAAVRCLMVGMLSHAGRLRWLSSFPNLPPHPATGGNPPSLAEGLSSVLLGSDAGFRVRSRAEYEVLEPLMTLRCR